MMRTASKVPTTPIEIAKSRSTVDENPCDPDEESDAEEELDEDEDAVPDVVPVVLPVCIVNVVGVVGVEEVVVSEGSRTSKLDYVKSISFHFLKDNEQLT
jgi:hypothetical protein